MAPETGAEVVLRLDGITKRFGPLLANDAISFGLGKGEVIALLGENGALVIGPDGHNIKAVCHAPPA